jgi:predicted RNase H-like HicB family nuclease
MYAWDAAVSQSQASQQCAQGRALREIGKFLVTLEHDEDGFVVVECPDLPGCLSQGRTEAEALANIREAIEASLETRREYGIAVS